MADTGLPFEPDAALLAPLRAVLGDEGVITGDARLPLVTDVYRRLETPIAVARPKTVEALAEAVRIATEAGVAVVPRGGGASYTDGYLATVARSLLVDVSGLDRIVEINETDAYVTVEAGCTWAALKAALDAKGLRTPFQGPFSGLLSTVGGAMSQYAISHGSGAHGISAQSVLSMDVVLADGSILSTGSAARGAAPFGRFYGPDLAGLFCGDAGALGIKARVTLPLLKIKPAFQAASFAFDSFAAMHGAMRAAAMEGLDHSHFALDAALSQGQVARQDGASKFAIAMKVLETSPNLIKGLATLARMGAAGDRALKASAFYCHWLIEGCDDGEAKAKLHRLREIAGAFGAEIPNTVPTVVRGMPFAPFFNVLGPKGERWVPLHGVMSHSKALAFHDALAKLYADEAPAMARHGVTAGGMFETVGSSGFLYEIALYWPDTRNDYHPSVVPADYLAGLPAYPENLAARAYVHELKSKLIDLYGAFGATHFQLGKAYPYASAIGPEPLAAVRALKAHLDPKGLMNPGALGL